MNDIKKTAKKLKTVSKKFGYDIKHTHALEIVSQVEFGKNRHCILSVKPDNSELPSELTPKEFQAYHLNSNKNPEISFGYPIERPNAPSISEKLDLIGSILVVGHTRSGKTETIKSLLRKIRAGYSDAKAVFVDGKCSPDYDMVDLSDHKVFKPYSNSKLEPLEEAIKITLKEIEKRKNERSNHPPLFLVIDDYDAFSFYLDQPIEVLEKTPGSPFSLLAQVLREGVAYNVRCIFSLQKIRPAHFSQTMRASINVWMVHSVYSGDAKFLGVNGKCENLKVGEYILKMPLKMMDQKCSMAPLTEKKEEKLTLSTFDTGKFFKELGVHNLGIHGNTGMGKTLLMNYLAGEFLRLNPDYEMEHLWPNRELCILKQVYKKMEKAIEKGEKCKILLTVDDADLFLYNNSYREELELLTLIIRKFKLAGVQVFYTSQRIIPQLAMSTYKALSFKNNFEISTKYFQVGEFKEITR